MQELIKANQNLLESLIYHLNLLTKEEYSRKEEILYNSSIGEHVRHIYNFFESLLNGINSRIIDYDKRIRDTKLETDLEYATLRLSEIIRFIQNLEHYKDMYLELNFSINGSKKNSVPTSFKRELHYVNEHTIHHMAIIRIAFIVIYPEIPIEKNFGFAYSTIAYLENLSLKK